MRRMTVPEGRRGSYEDVMHRIGDSLVLMSELPALPELLEPRGHRAIGVVYRPQFERFGNYVPTVLPKRYDAMLFVDETSAVNGRSTCRNRASQRRPRRIRRGCDRESSR